MPNAQNVNILLFVIFVLKHEVLLKEKSAAESHRMLSETYDQYALL